MSRSPKKSEKDEAQVPETPAEKAMCVFMSTAKAIHRFGESRISRHKQFSKLSGPRIGVLFIVNQEGSIRMSDLAGKLMVAPRTVTDLVDGLERDGFLRRVVHPTDRRAMLIELTPEIKADFGKITAIKRKFVEEVFSALTVDEQQQLAALLQKLQSGALSEFIQEIRCSPKD